MALSDEFNSCTTPPGYPGGERISGRPKTFCKTLTVLSLLTAASDFAAGPSTLESATVGTTLDIGSDLTVAGAATVTGALSAGTLILGGAILPPPAGGAPPVSRTRSTRSVSAQDPMPKGDLSVAGTCHVGSLFKLGSGYFASFKVDGLTETTAYTLPTSLPTSNGDALVASTSGVMRWVAGGSGGFTDPMTTAGDMIVRNSLNITTRLGAGTEGQILAVTNGGNELIWSDPDGGIF